MPKQALTKEQKAAARQRLKEKRTGGLLGASALDELGDFDNGGGDDDSIFDVVSEEQYEQIVRSRRERDNFVVDDDGLGYADDGEETWRETADDGDDEDRRGGSKKQKKQHANAALTDKALRKMRKTKAAAAAAAQQEAAVGNNRSMWEFVNKGVSAAAAASTASTKSTNRSNKRPAAASSNSAAAANLNDLLGALDDPNVLGAATGRKKKRQHQHQQRYSSRGRSSSRGGGAHWGRGSSSMARPRFAAGRSPHSSSFPTSGHHHDDGDRDNCGDGDFPMADAMHDDPADDDFGGGGGGGDTMWEDDDDNHNDYNESASTAKKPKVSFAEKDDKDHQQPPKDSNDSDRSETMDVGQNKNQKQPSAAGDSDEKDPEDEPEAAAATATQPAAAPRRKLARPRLGRVTKAAAQAARAKEGTAATATTATTQQQQQPAVVPPPTIRTSAPSFQAVAAETGASTAAAGQMDLAEYLKQQQQQLEDERPYMDMYYMDLCERNGDIFLFGKVALDNSNKNDNNNNNHPQFVSACAVVSGNQRNLFVLPRPDHEILDVHGEINTLLHQQGIVPKQTGASWAGKPVDRAYAFGDPAVPRETKKYLKVVYDGKYTVPSEELCSQGGTHFAKILGAGASVTENFIVKRKLQGPCWVRLYDPKPASHGPLSWCKVECRLEDPKQLVRLDLALAAEAAKKKSEDDADLTSQQQPQLQPRQKVPPPPPVVTMSIKLKTVVNTKTHKSEIVSVSAVCHKNVQLETGSDESHRHMTQLSIIRPLPKDGASGVAQFPRDIDAEIGAHMPSLRREPNERALLSRLMAQIGQWDPDVIVGHNAWGFDLEVLLTRCTEHKIRSWSRIGRRRRTELPSKTHFSARKDHAIADALAGRLLCDTYLSAKELLRETTYSLTNLAATQLKTTRREIESQDIPQWFQAGSKSIVHLAQSTLLDAQLVQKLMFKLQVLPLTKQLTCIAGNLWSHTLRSNRAERTEYLLLHEFHKLKYLPPDKKRFGTKRDPKDSAKSKAKYSGGLVLEPKKGLYDSFILLLDFNSLYPSIIQEYNLCFTTIDWSSFTTSSGEEDDNHKELPPVPDEKVKTGVLPKVIKNLVERRRSVKSMLKKEQNPEKRAELDIRQQALKLTANSMYGCLGFSNSRFFAQPIAAMVTAMGRETLQRTVNIAQNSVGLEVIYGDTDSIMINTRINDESDLKKVKELGEKVKKEVNRLYRTLELEIDGIFRSMLLLKKKKYAAKTVIENADGSVKYGQELKGLDLVRRDWCIQSKDTGRYVTEQILSGQDSEVVLENIYTHLEELATKMRAGELPLEKYVITKGLSKHPNDYPDGKSQPHVQVAKMMLKENRAVNTGDHIPYIVTAPPEQDAATDQPLAKAASAAERARHPEEIARSAGALKPDIEWYLTQQILPPISRLCEPIDGTSQQILAEKLGLDSSRYNQIHRSTADVDGDIDVDYTPASFLSDEERFKDVEKLKLFCFSCGTESAFPGIFSKTKDAGTGMETLASGLRCTNPNCAHPQFWGHTNHFECYSRISNSMSIWTRGLMGRYYEGLSRCDEPSCGLETRQLSVAGGVCLRRGCNGKMCSVDSERDIYTHLKYLESLFNAEHVGEQLEKKKAFGRKADILQNISRHDRATFEELHREAKRNLEASAFNWISPSFWQELFQVGAKQ